MRLERLERPPLRRRGLARRLRAGRPARDPQGRPARPRDLRRQPRPQRRRGHALLRHRRRRAWRRRCTACAPSRSRSTTARPPPAARPLRRGARPRRGAPAPAARRPGLAARALRRLLQRQLPAAAGRRRCAAPAPPSRATARAPTFGVLPHVAPNGRTFLWLTHGHGNADTAAGLGLPRVPRRLHHRDAADRRPDRARPHRAACAGARLGRGSAHAPRRTADAVRLHPPLARGDQRRGAEGDGADAAHRLPRRHLPGALLRGHAAADRLRPDHQPADRRRADDPGARGRPAAARCSRSAPAPATRRRSSPASPGGSTPSSATAGSRAAPASSSSGSACTTSPSSTATARSACPSRRPSTASS